MQLILGKKKSKIFNKSNKKTKKTSALTALRTSNQFQFQLANPKAAPPKLPKRFGGFGGCSLGFGILGISKNERLCFGRLF
jgi:hypothetical protein